MHVPLKIEASFQDSTLIQTLGDGTAKLNVNTAGDRAQLQIFVSNLTLTQEAGLDIPTCWVILWVTFHTCNWTSHGTLSRGGGLKFICPPAASV